MSATKCPNCGSEALESSQISDDGILIAVRVCRNPEKLNPSSGQANGCGWWG
jgi:hypothetical protein